MEAGIINNFLNSIQFEMLTRLVVSAILGGIVGLERGSGDRPAGFRTHILVCAGSALLMLVSLYGFDGFDAVPFEYPRNRDSARIAAQVVSGIGFLGAGTILHEGITVRGLTTAASLWMVSAIGLAAGAGMYMISCVATAITMITLVTFHNWEKRFAGGSKSERRFIRIVAGNNPGIVSDLTGYLNECGIRVKNINIRTDSSKNKTIIELYLKVDKDMDKAAILDCVHNIEGIESIENVG